MNSQQFLILMTQVSLQSLCTTAIKISSESDHILMKYGDITIFKIPVVCYALLCKSPYLCKKSPIFCTPFSEFSSFWLGWLTTV